MFYSSFLLRPTLIDPALPPLKPYSRERLLKWHACADTETLELRGF